MLRFIFVVVIIGQLLAQAGCNFVQMKQVRLERFIRQQGLKETFATLGEDHIRYWEGGTGETLLLLHGFGGDATWGWGEQVEALAKHFHLVIPDLLWFGKSTSTQADFTLAHQARTMQALMAHLKLERYHIAGISYGGIVALAMLSRPDNSIDKAIIVASPGTTYTRADYEALLTRFDIKSMDELVLPQDGQGLKRLLDVAYKNSPYIPSIFHQNVLDAVILPSREEKVALLEQLVSEMEALKTMQVQSDKKILLIWGSEDPLFPLQLGERFKDVLGNNTRLKVIDGARHAPNLEFAHQFNRMVIRFLEPRAQQQSSKATAELGTSLHLTINDSSP